MSLKKIVSSVAALAIMGTSLVAAPNANTQIAQDGTGDYLNFPIYFAMQDGNWETNLKVVNTNTHNAVIAKVVIREGVESAEKIDFVIYLSPGDVWEGRLYTDANNNVFITSSDDSMIMNGKVATSAKPITKALFAPTGKQNNTFGYVEVYGLGSYPANLIPDLDGDGYTWGGVGTPLDKDDLYQLYVTTLHNNPTPNANWEGVGVDDLYGLEVLSSPVVKGEKSMTLPAFALEGVTGSNPNNSAVFGQNSTVDNSIMAGGVGDAPTPGVVVSNITALLNKQEIYATYYAGQNTEAQLLLTQPFKFAYGLDSNDYFEYNFTPRDQMEHTPQRTVDEVSGQVEETPAKKCYTEVCSIDVKADAGQYDAGYVTYHSFSNYVDVPNGATNIPVPMIPVLMSATMVNGKPVTNIFYPAYNK